MLLSSAIKINEVASWEKKKKRHGEIFKCTLLTEARDLTRDLFKKIRDTKGTFHAKMGLIKDRNGLDLTEAEDIKRGGKNTQKNCTKKIFTAKIITMV